MGGYTVLSLEDFQEFIESGKYIERAEGIKQLKILRNHIHEYQLNSGKKRMEWTDQGVVGIFEGNRVYETDTDQLKSHLYNIGILPLVCKVDWSLLSNEERSR